MLTDAGLYVLEFNARMGDPEASTVLPLLESPDLTVLFESALQGNLDEQTVRFSSDAAVTTVMASGGYPGSYATGMEISGLEMDLPPGVSIHHAGTRRNEQGKIETTGGRVLVVRGQAPTHEAARRLTHDVIGEGKIHFVGAQWRRDIGHQVIAGK